MTYFSPTDLIINPDGSSYHLNLRPDQIPDTLILVGDPERVPKVSQFFDEVTEIVHKREFVTHLGILKGKRIAVLSSGIGADNVEIVMNELDALVNIDFQTRLEKQVKRSLNLIRIGTSGSIQAHIPVDSILISNAAIGFDNLAQFYGFNSAQSISADSLEQWTQAIDYPLPLYAAKASANLLEKFKPLNAFEGITLTAPGFYAPQGRTIRLHSIRPDFLEKVAGTKLEGQEITNIEMETAAYYAFAGAMGHEMISLNALLANRITNEFSKDPEGQIMSLIEKAIALIA
ncbi:nucleoside phosphorylase [Aquirufa novilacunae]|uniref:Uridine phosphorylase n=1 Tax=Aquirufa novilacunae TaxID=3139305 RepID=A0ABW8U2L0_9BACT